MSTTAIGNSLTITDSDCLMEFKDVADTKVTTGWAAAKASLKIWEYVSSGTTTRSTTKITVKF